MEFSDENAINGQSWGGFPREDVPNSTKSSQAYILSYFKAMYYQQFRKSAFSFYYENETQRITSNRKWAEGLNSVDEFKPLLGVVEGSTSYLNLDWSILPVIKKYVNLRVGEMTNIEYKILAKAVDALSLTEQDKERNKREALMKLKPISDELEQISGVPLIPPDEYVPENKEEMELHHMINFKLDTEISMEKSIDYHLLLNDWKDKIWEKVCQDMVTIKKSAVKAYFDENKRIRLRYTDFGNCVYPYCIQEDFSDARYFGEIIKVRVSDLKRMDVNGNLSDEDLFQIAKKYQGKYGNRVWEREITTFHQYFEVYGKTETWFDDFLIPVLDGEFISISVDKWEEKPNNKGGMFFNKKSSQYELDEEKKVKGRKLIKKELEYKYKGKWIVDTDYVIDFGLANDMVRNVKSGKISPKCQSSYIVLSPDILDMENRAMVEDMIPAGKQVQIAYLKIQQLIAKLTPPGKAVDASALRKVILGGGKTWEPLDIMDLGEATGWYFYEGTDDNGLPMNRKPIEAMKDSMGGLFGELIETINFNMMLIQSITGINDSRDASSPDKDSLVGLQKMALAASRNATRKIDKAVLKVLKMSSERISSMFQYNVRHGRNIEEYKRIMGAESVNVVKAMKDLPMSEFGIFVEARLDEQERMLFEQSLMEAVKTKELRPEDADMARQIMNTKLANKFLNYRRKKYQEEQMTIARQNAMDNAAIQEKSAAAKAEGDIMVIQAKTEGKVEELKAEYTLKEWLAQKDHARQKELESLKINEKADRSFQEAAIKTSNAGKAA